METTTTTPVTLADNSTIGKYELLAAAATSIPPAVSERLTELSEVGPNYQDHRRSGH